MDDENHSDRLLSEPPEMADERDGRMSLGATPNVDGDDVSPVNGDSVPTSAAPATQNDPHAKAVNDVVSSEIGVNTLLNRLKQSIASAKEFATFLKERSSLEEKHSNGLKKLCRGTADNIRRPDQRHGSFLAAYEGVNSIHERMAENGTQFAVSLHQMHDDLMKMVANTELGRKQWKTQGLNAEKRVADTEDAMRKSKAKYDSLAEDYDRARTGDRQAGKKFGLKGPKSAQQHEEDLLRKVQAADQDYASKVQTTQSQRSELHSTLRPNAIKELQNLIKECDSALTLQMQKFASFNEKLLLSNGLNISPLRGNENSTQRSLREVVHSIDNEKDLSSYVASFANKVAPKGPEIVYQKNPVLSTSSSAPPPQRLSEPPTSFNSRQGPPQSSFGVTQPAAHQPSMSQSYNQAPPSAHVQQHERSFSQGPMMPQYGSAGGQSRGPSMGQNYTQSPISASGPPQLSSLPFQTSQPPPAPSYPQQQSSYSQSPTTGNNGHLPPVMPVFGLSLDQLFERDGSAVPMVVYQCIQAVDLFGLEVEGIYRISGTASHISKMKAMFDNDASRVDFRNPENFMHDVNSVAGLLKQFFRDLPDPLLTREHYPAFIEAANNEDLTVRRDSLHALINSLPDPNYATLRALTLHLHRVQEAAGANRMNAANLAIVFGPTLMGSKNIADAGPQVTVVQTVLDNTYQIFDDD